MPKLLIGKLLKFIIAVSQNLLGVKQLIKSYLKIHCKPDIDHIHPPEAGLLKRTVIAAKVRVEAIQHPYRASGDIVEDAFSITNENDFNLPNQQYLQRAANCIRQKLRPAEPKDLCN